MDNCLLIKPKYELWTTAQGYRIFCYNHRLANKINKHMKAYPDYSFVEGEEAIFRGVPAHVLPCLGLSSRFFSSLLCSTLRQNKTLESTNADGGDHG